MRKRATDIATDHIEAARMLLSGWSDSDLQAALATSARRMRLCGPAGRAVIAAERRMHIDELERRRVDWAAASWPPATPGADHDV